MKLQEEQQERKNLIIAALLVTGVLYGTNILFPKPQTETLLTGSDQTVAEQTIGIAKTSDSGVIDLASVDSKGINSEQGIQTETSVLKPIIPDQIIQIQNEAIKGSYNIQKGKLSQVDLLKYKQTTQDNSPAVSLLTDTYYTQMGWKSPDAVIPVPIATDKDLMLQPNKTIIATGQTDDLKLTRQVTVDNDYMVSTTDTLTNLTDKPIQVYFGGEIVRTLSDVPAVSTVHEGFIAVLKDKLIEEKYDDIADEVFEEKTKGGWFGITDKYWQTALILDGKEWGKIRFEKGLNDVYKAEFSGVYITIPAGESYTHTSRIFAGAKTVDLLTRYEKQYNIPKFDLTIDFGWFYFLTKPFLHILNWLYGLLGNMGIAILVFATLIRLLLLPVATKSYESMAKMRKLQPRLAELKTRFKNDPSRLQIEMMNLYKREKVSPASGCLPIFLQIPVFYALYKVLSVSINMRQAPFYGWIEDLSVPDPSSVFTAFGYLDWPIPAFLNLGVLPILMGLTMVIQQKFNPTPPDPVQAKVLKWMPVLFTFMLGGFAAGLILYWTWSNILSIFQQKYIMHKVGVK